MNKNDLDLIQELICLENKVAEIYGFFMENFEEDNEFWEKIRNEEENHAIILDNAQKQFSNTSEFPEDLLMISLSQAKMENIKLDNILKKFKLVVPTKKNAFETALEIEKFFSEYIFQKAMDKPNPGNILKIIQKINDDEKNHIERILIYMKSENIRF